MNEVEKELLKKNIINLKGFTSKNKERYTILIDITRLFLYPGLLRKMVNLLWNKIKYISFDKILVLDDIAFKLSIGLVLEHGIIIEQYSTFKKDYKGSYLLLFGHVKNLDKFNKKMKHFKYLNVTIKYSLILFDSTKQIESIKGKKDILFFPKKKQKKNCIVLNWKKFEDIVKTIHYYGEKIDIIKIYVNTIIDFDKSKINIICKLSRKYKFLIWEGSILSDDVTIFFYQISGNYTLHKWIHIIELNTDNIISIKKILEALDSNISINLQNEFEITYYFKNDYFDKKFLSLFNER